MPGAHVARVKTPADDAAEGARHLRELAAAGKTPLQIIAAMMVRLSYADFMTMSRDIHSDSDTIGKTPNDVADILASWAFRQIDATRARE